MCARSAGPRSSALAKPSPVSRRWEPHQVALSVSLCPCILYQISERGLRCHLLSPTWSQGLAGLARTPGKGFGITRTTNTAEGAAETVADCDNLTRRR
jgi:hypothetical protein